MGTGIPQVAGSAAFEALRPLTDQEFLLFRTLIAREVGIHLSDAKKALVSGRLSKRLRELGLKTYAAYYRAATHDPLELTRLIDRISTNETHFFREPRQFEFLTDHVLPGWLREMAAGRRPRRIRVWSAACSTGEEPYSIAMALLDRLAAQPACAVEIFASDISTRVLERAEAAVWPVEKAEEIPERHLRRFMLRGTRSQAGQMQAGPALRSAVRFARINLHSPGWQVPGPFDLIFCRNVLIYFDSPTKMRVVQRLLDVLAPGGLLFLGHAESLAGLNDRVASVGPTVYAPKAALDAAAR